MTPVQETAGANAAGQTAGNPQTITFSSGPTGGNTIVLVLLYQGSSSAGVISSVSDSQSNGPGGQYLQQIVQVASTATPHAVAIYVVNKISTSATPITISVVWAQNVTDIAWVAYELPAPFPGSDFLSISGSTNTNAAPTQAINPAVANEFLVMGVFPASSPTITLQPGWSEDTSTALGQGIFSISNPTVGSYNANPCTLSASVSNTSACVAFAPAASVVITNAPIILKNARGKWLPRGVFDIGTATGGGQNAQTIAAMPGWTCPGCTGVFLELNWGLLQPTKGGSLVGSVLDFVINSLCPYYNKPIGLVVPTGQQNGNIGYPSWLQQTQSGTATNGSNIITGLSNTALLSVGMTLTGTGFPVNPAVLTTISSIDSSSQIHISANFTGTTGSVSITFGPEMLAFSKGTFPAPWDPTYQAALSSFVAALGARYDSSPYLAYLSEFSCGYGPQANFATTVGDNTIWYSGDAYGGSSSAAQAGWLAAVATLQGYWLSAFPTTPTGWTEGTIVGPSQVALYNQSESTIFRKGVGFRLNNLRGDASFTKITSNVNSLHRLYSVMGGQVGAFQEVNPSATFTQFVEEILLMAYCKPRVMECFPFQFNLGWTPQIIYADTLLKDPHWPGPSGLSPIVEFFGSGYL